MCQAQLSVKLKFEMNPVIGQLSISSSELNEIGVNPNNWAYLDVYQRARLASVVLRGRGTAESNLAANLLDVNNQNALAKLQLIITNRPLVSIM